ncbi:MAG: hypothetical protein GY934_07130, partial [Gammaproteobacteria bacterium]|nr:hypothetical protein [Gammaproteobacteria bacterium]
MTTKKNKSFLTTSAVIVIIVAAVAIYQFYQLVTSESIPEATTSTKSQTETGAKNIEDQNKIGQNDSASKKTPTEADLSKVDKRLTPQVLDRIKYFEKRAKRINGPIEFYGKVVDQYGEPVIGARVTIELKTSNESLLAALLKNIGNDNIFAV